MQLKRFMKTVVLSGLASLAMASGSAQASTYFVLISDMSQVQWQIDATGTVWFRNLNHFDSSVLGCCYNYSLDTTTSVGKSMWAAMLAKVQAAQPLWIGLSNGNSSPGTVIYAGNW
jgi:hypothetical protein